MTRSKRQSSPAGTLLEQTLAAAVRDVQTVTPDSVPLRRLIEGVKIREARTHVDARGMVVEIFDERWGWHPEPVRSLHCFTLRPGYVKGWGLHKEHEDRYFVVAGEMELVLFDPRPQSSTYGEICRIIMGDSNRCLVNIPTCVWHAERNIGSSDVIAIDMPTVPYNHANPDKYRLPIDTPLIPYSFGDAKGW